MKGCEFVGCRFGRLTVLRRSKKIYGRKAWLCVCDCGKETIVGTGSLTSGNTKSCGCLALETRRKNGLNNAKHNQSYERIYQTWRGMKKRCMDKEGIRWKVYGARGITVCDEWLNNFEAFYEWSKKSGYKDNLTIDRIDNEKGYFPENCRWATPKQQARNRTNTTRYTLDGQTKPLIDWAEEMGMNYSGVYERYRSGYDPFQQIRGKVAQK